MLNARNAKNCKSICDLDTVILNESSFVILKSAEPNKPVIRSPGKLIMNATYSFTDPFSLYCEMPKPIPTAKQMIVSTICIWVKPVPWYHGWLSYSPLSFCSTFSDRFQNCIPNIVCAMTLMNTATNEITTMIIVCELSVYGLEIKKGTSKQTEIN